MEHKLVIEEQFKSIKKGIFITIEGIEGVGKTTAHRFLSDYVRQKKIPLCVTREPGGTEIAEHIRHVLLANYRESMVPDTELLLAFASRAQHLHQVILPSLSEGQWVLCDRFTDASFAYQGGGRGIPMERITQLAAWLNNLIVPDLTFLLDAPLAVAMERAHKRSHPDRIETEATHFFDRVRRAYLARAETFPKQFRVIDAHQPFEKVAEQLMYYLEDLIHYFG